MSATVRFFGYITNNRYGTREAARMSSPLVNQFRDGMGYLVPPTHLVVLPFHNAPAVSISTPPRTIPLTGSGTFRLT